MARPGGQIAADILLQPMMVVPFGLMAFMLFKVIRAATARGVPSVGGVTADGGRVVPLKASFTGLRGLPRLVAIASNNASPLLMIYPDRIDYRVIQRRQRPMGEIEMVDVQTAWRTVNIVLHFRNSPLTFSGNVGTEDAAKAALNLLPRSVPITPAALAMAGRLAG